MTDAATGPTPEFDLQGPGFVADPYPTYHALRAADPVHWSEPLGCWVVTRYDDALAVLGDPARFSSRVTPPAVRPRAEALAPFLRLSSQWLLFQDPPGHTAARVIVQPGFTPRAAEALRPAVRRIADGLLDRLAGAGRMDLLRDFAGPLTAAVLAERLCPDPGDCLRVAEWCRGVATANDFPDDAEARRRGRDCTAALTAYLTGLVAEARRRPAGGLIDRLLAGERQGQRLSDEEVCAQCLLVLFAGNETTRHLIGNGVRALLRHPDQLDTLRGGPALIPDAVEELLRFDGPVQGVSRMAAADVTLRGRRIKAGEEVVVLLGSANRDPARFPDPDRLDVRRRDNRHLAFGAGPHFCLGAALARVGARTALEVLLRRLPRLRLTGEPPRWRDGNLVARGLKALPVAF